MARILLCDDALFMRGTLSMILEGAGHQIVAQASDGEECISQVQVYHPDLILMDITMPGMDGITATQKIMEIDPNVKIIMVSAIGQQEKVFSSIKAGAKDFIVKPFEASKLLACVDKVLRM